MLGLVPNDDESRPPVEELVEVGRYRRFSVAQERGLVAAALELPYWVIREGREFVLYVEPPDGDRVRAELATFEAEATARSEQQARVAPPLRKLETMSLFIAAWVMSSFWAAQNYLPPTWIDRGDASNREILHGEWWRTITALTLHGDLPHFIANLAFGLLFAGFLLPRFGAGVSWLGFVLSGALGNLLNAIFYQSMRHTTIGASTAVFGGLGMLVAWELVARWRSPHERIWWQLVVPLGGGLALLAYLGSGDEAHTDIDHMAHWWGFVAGMLVGVAFCVVTLRPISQRIAGLLAFFLPVLAWLLALLRPD